MELDQLNNYLYWWVLFISSYGYLMSNISIEDDGHESGEVGKWVVMGVSGWFWWLQVVMDNGTVVEKVITTELSHQATLSL